MRYSLAIIKKAFALIAYKQLNPAEYLPRIGDLNVSVAFFL